MKVVDNSDFVKHHLVVEDIKERQVFMKIGDNRPPKNEHIYMLARPNKSRTVRITAVPNDTVLVVNISFGTLHAMPKGTLVRRVHGEIHLQKNCTCCCCSHGITR